MSKSADRRALAVCTAVAYDGVLSRSLLADLGADRRVVAREVAAGRWATHGRRTVAMHTAPLGADARLWRAVWEVGCGGAVDGVSALHKAGMVGFTEDLVHVSVPQDARPIDVSGVRIHRVSRGAVEVLTNGMPRVRTPVAAIRAACWARTDRQASLLLAMPLQQRLLSATQLKAAADVVTHRRRRALIPKLVTAIVGGAQSLGELDFAAMCRRRGLPAPSRQAVRELPNGRVYLDVAWSEISLAVEIDGSGHLAGLAATDDSLRQNWVVLGGETVIRMTALGLRLHREEFLDQVCQAHALLRARGAA
jgi:very-short-patch-repair endonuclease